MLCSCFGGDIDRVGEGEGYLMEGKRCYCPNDYFLFKSNGDTHASDSESFLLIGFGDGVFYLSLLLSRETGFEVAKIFLGD